MRQFRILVAACGLAFAFATASPAVAGAVSQEAQVATVKADSDLRSQPTTASPILAELQAETTVDIICWAYGEPTYGTDPYGSMWLYGSLGGWVHSFLVTPVEVGPCAAAGYGFYSGRIPSAGGFANCDQAILAGAALMFAGEAGYDPHLDRDGDGIACEWDD